MRDQRKREEGSHERTEGPGRARQTCLIRMVQEKRTKRIASK
jgi:hypothetical protein